MGQISKAARRLGAIAAGIHSRAGIVTASSASQQKQHTELVRSLECALAELGDVLAAARERCGSVSFADAEIFHKGLEWALRYPPTDGDWSDDEVSVLLAAAARGVERAEALEAAGGEPVPWASASTGKLALGYKSAVDGSCQPYGLVVPAGLDPSRPVRLDVVLHGSQRPLGMSELLHIAKFDIGDRSSTTAPCTTNTLSSRVAPPHFAEAPPFLELHPLGRVENCYRYSGETDVLEAIEDVCRRYNVDRERVVLRGMSMGASGTWHIGLKHPDMFAALGPYCGYVDTHHFSHTPAQEGKFIKVDVGKLPQHQRQALRMLDSVGYAANAATVPVIAAVGDQDGFIGAHELMATTMRSERLHLTNLISPGTGHVVDPVTHAEQMRHIAAHCTSGINRRTRSLRFVTWSLKYSRCHWIQLLRLNRHYQRAEIVAHRSDDDETVILASAVNIDRFAIVTTHLPRSPRWLRFGSQELELPDAEAGAIVVARTGTDGWKVTSASDLHERSKVKRPGLQGPIDDAFDAPFLCVRGTGTAWSTQTQAYAEARLREFAAEWHQYFRGELPIKDDTAVSPEDVESKHLVLFGDPGSNFWIAKALPALPLKWNERTLALGNVERAAADHLPALIVPSPLDGAAGKYCVLNSGHSFRYEQPNYLLYPRWGDWAVLKVPVEQGSTAEKVVKAGYFDESWAA